MTMTEYHFRRIVLTTLLTFFVNIGNADIVTGPRSTAVQVESSAFFNCSTSRSDEIQWFHYTVGADDRTFVYGYDKFYAPYEGRFKMEKNGPAYNLIIPSTKFEDAGKYECQDNLGSGDKRSAQLTVLDQGPICQSDKKIERIIGPNSCGIEPDDLLLTCTIQYRGNEVPILEWRNRVTNDIVNKGIIVGSKDNYVVLNLTMKGDPSLDDSTYLCQTIITTPSPYSCAIGPVKVLGTSDTSCSPHVIVIVCIAVLLVGCVIILCFVLIRYMATRRRRAAVPKEGNDKKTTPEELVLLQDMKGETNKSTGKEESRISKQLQKDKNRLEAETQLLLDKLREAEHRLYNSDSETIRYLDKPKFLHSFEMKSDNNEGKVICGIAILKPNLFVVFENSQEIEIYDSVTFNSLPKCVVDKMTHPVDIASSKANGCFYVHVCTRDNVNNDSESQILKINPKGQLIQQWATDGGPGRLSTSESNVIACFLEKSNICEYSGIGELLRRIPLSPAYQINRPLHAIKVSSMHYVVSHCGVGENSHRLCLVDCAGKVIKVYANSTEKLMVPISLAENSDKCIIVADRDSRQILLLNYVLKFKGKLLSEKLGLKNQPVRLAFDDSGNLFVAENRLQQNKEWQGVRISVCGIMEENLNRGSYIK